jgi:hypothetical protein
MSTTPIITITRRRANPPRHLLSRGWKSFIILLQGTAGDFGAELIEVAITARLDGNAGILELEELQTHPDNPVIHMVCEDCPRVILGRENNGIGDKVGCFSGVAGI